LPPKSFFTFVDGAGFRSVLPKLAEVRGKADGLAGLDVGGHGFVRR